MNDWRYFNAATWRSNTPGRGDNRFVEFIPAQTAASSRLTDRNFVNSIIQNFPTNCEVKIFGERSLNVYRQQ
jgi:hypothetical protein